MSLPSVKTPKSAPIDASALTLIGPANVAEVAPPRLLRAPVSAGAGDGQRLGKGVRGARRQRQGPAGVHGDRVRPPPNEELFVATSEPALMTVGPV